MNYSPYIAFVNVGFGHSVVVNKIKCLTLPRTSPGMRMIKIAKQDNRYIDCTCGKPARTLIVMDDNTILASAFKPATLVTRFRQACFEFLDDTIPSVGTKEWLEATKARMILEGTTVDEPEEIVDLDESGLPEYEQDPYSPPPLPDDDDDDSDIPDELEDNEDDPTANN